MCSSGTCPAASFAAPILAICPDVTDRPFHRVVILMASDSGRNFSTIVRYRANGRRSVFGHRRYWRLQYPLTGNQAAQVRKGEDVVK